MAEDLKYRSIRSGDMYTIVSSTHNRETLARVVRADGFSSPGIQTTCSGRDDVQLDMRIRAGWGAFYKHHSIHCLPTIIGSLPLLSRSSKMQMHNATDEREMLDGTLWWKI